MFHRLSFRSFQGRYFAAQAAKGKSAEQKNVSLPKQQPKVTTLPTGLVVASLENNAPISNVSVVFKAGARHESGKNSGITHVLRNAAGLTTQEASVFGISRSIPQLGASLSCTSDREHLGFTLECSRDILDVGLRFLANVSTQPTFKPWELKDIVHPRLHVDLAELQQNPQVQVLEALHKVAYRAGLGNSVYCPEWALGTHGSQQLNQYVKQHCTAGRAAIVGTGIDHDILLQYVNDLFKVEPGQGAETVASKYGGGEIRIENNSSIVYAAIATEGVSLSKPQDIVALGVLQQIVGVGPQIKRGDASGSRLGQALTKVSRKPHVGSSLNINYSDGGLFGVYIAGQADDMGKLLKAAVGTISGLTKSGGITDKDVQQGKQRLKASVHLSVEGGQDMTQELAARALANIPLPGDIDSLIDNVKTADVVALAKKVIAGKPSMAALGDLTHTPHLDQLL